MDIPKTAYLENHEWPNIKEKPILVLQTNSEPCWMDPLIYYLQEGTLSKDKAEIKRLKNWPTLFVVLNKMLYKQA